MTAARGAESADETAVASEIASVRLQPADPKVYLGDGFRISGRRRHAKIERHHDDARRGKTFMDRCVVKSIVFRPRSPVDVHDRGKRPVPFGLIDPR